MKFVHFTHLDKRKRDTSRSISVHKKKYDFPPHTHTFLSLTAQLRRKLQKKNFNPCPKPCWNEKRFDNSIAILFLRNVQFNYPMNFLHLGEKKMTQSLLETRKAPIIPSIFAKRTLNYPMTFLHLGEENDTIPAGTKKAPIIPSRCFV